MEEEGSVIVGMLVGLNVIDANLCVKGEDLDSQVTHTRTWFLFPGLFSMQEYDLLCVIWMLQVGVIDFSLYLKDPQTTESPQE